VDNNRYTYFGAPITPIWRTSRRVAGGTCVDVIATHPADGKTYTCTVNRANIRERT
jgi:hypothetical protein